jgi:hypothetical protein
MKSDKGEFYERLSRYSNLHLYQTSLMTNLREYVRVLTSLQLFQFPSFLFVAQPKEFFLDGLKKLEQ